MKLRIFGLLFFAAIMLTLENSVYTWITDACNKKVRAFEFLDMAMKFTNSVCYAKDIDKCLTEIKRLGTKYNSAVDTSCFDNFIGKDFEGKGKCPPMTNRQVTKEIRQFPLYCCAHEVQPKTSQNFRRFIGDISKYEACQKQKA